MGKPHDDLIPSTLNVLILKSLTRGYLHGYGRRRRLAVRSM